MKYISCTKSSRKSNCGSTIPKQPEESVFFFEEYSIFDSKKTAPISNRGLVFSESNLEHSSSKKFRFFKLFGYRPLSKLKKSIEKKIFSIRKSSACTSLGFSQRSFWVPAFLPPLDARTQ